VATQLAEIKHDLDGSKARRGAMGDAELEHQPDVERRRGGDQGETGGQGHGKAQPERHEQHANGLTRHCEPAHQYKSLEA
jgi:hypothetical protein